MALREMRLRRGYLGTENQRLARSRPQTRPQTRPETRPETGPGLRCPGSKGRFAGFGESTGDFGVEHRVRGRDDGRNRHAGPVRCAICTALKAARTMMADRQQVMAIRGRPFG